MSLRDLWSRFLGNHAADMLPDEECSELSPRVPFPGDPALVAKVAQRKLQIAFGEFGAARTREAGQSQCDRAAPVLDEYA